MTIEDLLSPPPIARLRRSVFRTLTDGNPAYMGFLGIGPFPGLIKMKAERERLTCEIKMLARMCELDPDRVDAYIKTNGLDATRERFAAGDLSPFRAPTEPTP